MVDKEILAPQHQDFKALEDSTVIHIRGLKLQLVVAYATLKKATECRKATQKPEDEEHCTVQKLKMLPLRGEEEPCESTKTEDDDTENTNPAAE